MGSLPLSVNEEAKAPVRAFRIDFGRYELERYCDHCLTCRVPEHITRKTEKIILD